MKIKTIGCLIVILFSLSGNSQTFKNKWAGLFSYTNVIDLVEGNDRIIAASENAVFIYDLITNELTTFNTVDGLSGDLISTIYYSEQYNVIVIGYQNGLIEIIRDNSVLTVVDILNKPTIPPNIKRINHFNEYQGKIYIATQYGISVYDLQRQEFGDSYFIGDFGDFVNVNQTTVFEETIYAALNNKMKSASVNNPNLINFEEWNDFYPFGLKGVRSFGNHLIAIDFNSRLLRFVNGNAQVVANFPQQNINIYTSDQYVTVTSNTRSTTFDFDFNVVATVTQLTDYNYSLSNSLAYGSNVYLATKEFGVLEVPFNSILANQILPDGPLLNKSFGIDATPGQLWAVFGEVDLFFNPYPLNSRGISQFENNQWTNIPYEEVFDAKSIVHIKINPNNPSEVYASSMLSGLLKIVDKTPSILFNSSNSILNGTLSDNSIRIFGADFDRDGNLWFLQSSTDKPLHRLTTAGQMQAFDISGIVGEPFAERGFSKMGISREGNIFFAGSANGLIGYNPQLNKFKRIGEGIGTGNLPTINTRAVAVDNRNQVWIGTLRGLRVLFNSAGFFEDGVSIDAQPIIILDDDGVAQELLFEQSITDIEVDGANNKWIATASSGVFYVSPNGQQTLLRFNKDNSPLPSNSVLDIAIDSQSGVVYFATSNGIVAFNGTTTAPSENLTKVRAFPNPVRPGFTGNVTIDGLTARANVKITDVNGNLVFEQVSEGGSILWDTTAFGKHKVASGVYFIMVTTDDALETKIAKVMIVR